MANKNNAGKYTPPSGKQHPPAGKGQSVGGVHHPASIHNVNGKKISPVFKNAAR
jgi:hypothetical protein